jgi:hypothetical protein
LSVVFPPASVDRLTLRPARVETVLITVIHFYRPRDGESLKK